MRCIERLLGAALLPSLEASRQVMAYFSWFAASCSIPQECDTALRKAGASGHCPLACGRRALDCFLRCQPRRAQRRMPPRRATVRVAVPTPPRTIAFPRSFLVLTETRVFPATGFSVATGRGCDPTKDSVSPSSRRDRDSNPGLGNFSHQFRLYGASSMARRDCIMQCNQQSSRIEAAGICKLLSTEKLH